MNDQVHEYVQSLRARSETGSGNVITVKQDLQDKPLPHPIKFNSRLYEEISILPEWNNNNWDSFGIIVGKPGVGKTHLAEKIGLLLNADFNLENIFFTAQGFEDWLETAPKQSVGLYDEADELGSHHANKALRRIIRQSMRIRTKNHYVLLATPSLTHLNKHFIWRARFIIYVPMYGPTDRGYFNYYTGEDSLLDLYQDLKDHGERQSTYRRHAEVIENGYHGRDDTTNWFIEGTAYEARKEAARKEAEDTENITTRDLEWEANKAALLAHYNAYLEYHDEIPTQKYLGKKLGVKQQTISKWYKKLSGEGINLSTADVQHTTNI